MSLGGEREGAGRPGWRLKIESCERAAVYVAMSDRVHIGDQEIEIERVPCHFGGTRPYFLCPSCARRCLYLYRPPGNWSFDCRRCLDLGYAVECEPALYALVRERRKLQARLGPPHRSKPRGMHWRTYWPVYNRLEAIDAELRKYLAARLMGALPA